MDKITREQFDDAYNIVRAYQKQIKDEYEQVKNIVSFVFRRDTNIRDMNLSVRLMNVLNSANITTLNELLEYDRKLLMNMRCFGKKSSLMLEEFIDNIIIID